MTLDLTNSERLHITEILERRANEIATFRQDLEHKTGQKFHELPGSVELALSREIKRLRKLADRVKPPTENNEDDD